MEALDTIGYEGAELDQFIQTLIRHHLSCVLDARERAGSRKKGFSKTALRTTLAQAGIGYRHERALGSPRALRERLRCDGDYRAFFATFKQYLKTRGPLLRELAASLQGQVALRCYERDANRCHRRPVAGKLARLSGLTARDPVVEAAH